MNMLPSPTRFHCGEGDDLRLSSDHPGPGLSPGLKPSRSLAVKSVLGPTCAAKDLDMVTLEIKWISRSEGSHAWVTHVSGHYVDGTSWKLTEEDAIRGIESGDLEFFVVVEGRTLEVIVAGSRKGRKFLKTEADRERPDFLLKLPDLT